MYLQVRWQQMLDFTLLPRLLQNRWPLLPGETRGGSPLPLALLLPASNPPHQRKRRAPTITTLMKPVRTTSTFVLFHSRSGVLDVPKMADFQICQDQEQETVA